MIRLTPDTRGDFRHTVVEGDAWTPAINIMKAARWWRICDANPEYMSPLDLVGDAVTAGISFPIEGPVRKEASLGSLAESLLLVVGVEKVSFTVEGETRIKAYEYEGTDVPVIVEDVSTGCNRL
jgi:hypothetical protein